MEEFFTNYLLRRYYSVTFFLRQRVELVKKRIKGATLIEVLISLGVAAVVLSTIAGLTIRSLNMTSYSVSSKLASDYTKQGLEVVRSIRDASWNGFTTTYPTGDYCLDKASTTLRPKVGTCGKNYDLFTREVNIVHNSPLCSQASKVTVTTSWADKACSDTTINCHKIDLVACFSSYYVMVIPTSVPTPTITPTPTLTPTPTITPTPTPVTVNLSPTDDAYIDEQNNNTTEGTVDPNNLKVVFSNPSTSKRDQTLMKFDLTPYGGKTLISATLQIQVTDGTVNTLNFQKTTTTTWSESTVTWGNRPSFTGTNFTTLSGGSVGTLSINVASGIGSPIPASYIFSFGILSPSGSDTFTFNSKEAVAGKPLLILQYP